MSSQILNTIKDQYFVIINLSIDIYLYIQNLINF